MDLTFTGLDNQITREIEEGLRGLGMKIAGQNVSCLHTMCEYVIGMRYVCVCVCVLPFWETLERSVMILLDFLLLEGAGVVRGMANKTE